MSWIQCLAPKPDARLRLICLPPAGGGAASFRPWIAPLSQHFELWVAAYPGRAYRRDEPAVGSVEETADGVARAVREAASGAPWVAVGQSFGGVVGFEVAHRLRDSLVAFVPVAARACCIRYPHAKITHLSDEALVQHVGAQGGIPQELMRDPEMVSFIAPPLRHDFALIERYEPPNHAPLTQPIMAVGGTRDVLVRPPEVDAWRRHASGPFRLEMLDAGHFVPRDAGEIFFSLLSSFLQEAFAMDAPASGSARSVNLRH